MLWSTAMWAPLTGERSHRTLRIQTPGGCWLLALGLAIFGPTRRLDFISIKSSSSNRSTPSPSTYNHVGAVQSNVTKSRRSTLVCIRTESLPTKHQDADPSPLGKFHGDFRNPKKHATDAECSTLTKS